MTPHRNRPNIVYILADDLGYGDLGCYNPNCGAQTPALDELAGDGMLFSDSHTSSSVCTPTRYSIMTGRYNWRSRLKSGVLTGEGPMLLESGHDTAASFLQRGGYHTACVGKWHLGLGWQTTGGKSFSVENRDWECGSLKHIDYSLPVTEGPNDYGFDYSFIIPSSLDIPPYVYLENGRCTAIPCEENMLGVDTPYLMRRGIAAPGLKAVDVLPEFTRRACKCIDEHAESSKDDPLFLYFPLSAPHTPIIPADQYRGRTDIGLYGDFLVQVDAVVGAIKERLKAHGMYENTLLVFTSDNGPAPAAKLDELHDIGHEAGRPWRGHKADLYEGGHRTPFIVTWPGTVPEGAVCNRTICTTDFFATAAVILGKPLPEGAGEDSHSLMPLLRGGKPENYSRTETVHHAVDGHFAIRKGRWKLLEARGSGGWSYPREKEAAEWGLPEFQLYDLHCDPGETTNLAQAMPEKTDQLRQILDGIRGISDWSAP